MEPESNKIRKPMTKEELGVMFASCSAYEVYEYFNERLDELNKRLDKVAVKNFQKHVLAGDMIADVVQRCDELEKKLKQ